MQPPGAGLGIVAGEFDRVGEVLRDAIEVALKQPNDAAVQQVDGGNDFHAAPDVLHA